MPHEQFVGAGFIQHHAEQQRPDQHVCADQYADEHVRAEQHADQHVGASKFDVGLLVLHAVGPGQFDEHDETHHDVPGEAAPNHVGDGDRHRRRREADDDAAVDPDADHDNNPAAARRAERRARAATGRRGAWSGRAAW